MKSFTTVDIWWLNRKLSCDVCRSPNNRSLIWGFFKGTVHFEEPRESKIHKRNSLFWYILTLPFHRRNLYTPTEGVLIPIFNISGTILSLLILILGRLVTIHSLGSWNPNFPSHWWILEEKTDIALGLYFVSPDGRGGHPLTVCQNTKDHLCSIILWPIRWQGYGIFQMILSILRHHRRVSSSPAPMDGI